MDRARKAGDSRVEKPRENFEKDHVRGGKQSKRKKQKKSRMPTKYGAT